MTDDVTSTKPYGGNTRAAWLATATGIPIYVALAAIVWGPGVTVFEALADGVPVPTVDNETIAVIAAINVLIVLAGIAVVAHTVGRVVFARSLSMGRGKAAVAFGAMAAVLALVPVVFVAVGQGDTWAGAAAALIMILVPCAFTSAATRALLPSVDSHRWLRTAVVVLLVLALIAVVAFTLYTFAGIG